MRKELENRLAAEYPFMKRDPKAIKQHPIRDLYGAFGCDHGDGWYELLWSMCAEITAAYEERDMTVDIRVDQIKEKYGSLCFYFGVEKGKNRITPGYILHPMYTVINEIVKKYENLSETICEECGQPGVLRNDLSWIRTLCYRHYTEARLETPENIRNHNILLILDKVETLMKEGYTEQEAIQKLREEQEKPTT